MKSVSIYTDGACLGNPGPGGYGIILVYGKNRKELSGGYRLTTNNRMELMAAIQSLAALTEPCQVQLYSDSQYLVEAMEKGWAHRWKANNWYRNKQEKAANQDLWQELLNLCQEHTVRFVWIRGHDGHPENELCDKLAFAAAHAPELPSDEGYAKSSVDSNFFQNHHQGAL
jgi:ribonuclease HI